jgi:hypothetical protein
MNTLSMLVFMTLLTNSHLSPFGWGCLISKVVKTILSWPFEVKAPTTQIDCTFIASSLTNTLPMLTFNETCHKLALSPFG